MPETHAQPKANAPWLDTVAPVVGLTSHLRWHSILALLAVIWFSAGCTAGDSGQNGSADGTETIQQRVDETRERLTRNAGGELVLRAIDAHGGLEAWYRAPTSSYTWEYANVGADIQFESFLVADNRTRQVYHELLTVGPYGNPEPVDARFARDENQVWVYPPSVERPNPRFWATTGFYFEQIPFVLADPGLNYEQLPDDTLEGTRYEMVEVSYDAGIGESPGDTYTLYVHPKSGRVDAIRYTVTYGQGQDPDEIGPQPETLFFYEDYVTVDGLTVATHFRGYQYTDGQRGEFKNEAWADSISFRRPFDPSRLEAPEGARFISAP